MIHLIDGRNDSIVATIPKKLVEDNVHRKSKKDYAESFSFRAHIDDSFSDYIGERNRIVIEVEDGKFQEFIIQAVTKVHDGEGIYVDVDSLGSYQSLVNAKVIFPETLEGQTAKTSVQFALNATGFEVGVMPTSETKDVVIDSYTEPFSFIKRMSTKFGFDLDFRVEHDGNRITRRLVDFLDKDKEFSGRELVVGKDITSIERKEDTTEVVTSLIGLGPADSEGGRITVVVSDEDALARWGHNGRHLVSHYEVEGEEGMPEEEIRERTEAELQKRISQVVEYKAEVVDFEKLLNHEHKKIRFNDKIRIKDLNFSPPLFLEAEVHTQERDIYDREQKTVELGSFEEFSEEEILSIWEYLRREIQSRVTETSLLEYTYNKETIDTKDVEVLTEGKSYAETEASKAEQSSNQYTHAVLEEPLNRLDIAETQLETLDTNLSSAQSIIDAVTSEVQPGIHVLAGTLITNEVIAENATFTGSIEAQGLTMVHGTFQDVTITGTLQSVEINSANIEISEDIKVGNNIYLGDQMDFASEKHVYFNDGTVISANDVDMAIQARRLSILSSSSFGFSVGLDVYPGKNASIIVDAQYDDGIIRYDSDQGHLFTSLNGNGDTVFDTDLIVNGELSVNGSVSGQVIPNPFNQNLEFYRDNNTGRIVVRQDGQVIGALSWYS